jgi:hypothetical protein
VFNNANDNFVFTFDVSVKLQESVLFFKVKCPYHHHHHHHHKRPGLGHLDRSVSRVKVALSIFSLVSQLFSFLLGCKGMILKGFCFVAFFAGYPYQVSCYIQRCIVDLYEKRPNKMRTKSLV